MALEPHDSQRQLTYLKVNPDFVSRFGTLNISLLKPVCQGSQDTGRSLLQRTLGYSHSVSVNPFNYTFSDIDCFLSITKTEVAAHNLYYSHNYSLLRKVMLLRTKEKKEM